MPRGYKNIKYRFEDYVACMGRVSGTQYYGLVGSTVVAPEGEFKDPRIVVVPDDKDEKPDAPKE